MQGERKFAEKLTGKGTAARLRETVSEALRESTAPSKPKLIEPLDYETVIVKNKTLLTNDPHREMLLFPPDDVKDSTLPRRFRTVRCSVPPSAIKEATSLLVRECIKTYTSPWNVIHYKYSAFSGSYLQLPKVTKPDSLPAQVFEVDAEGDGKDDENNKRNLNITKQGWLYKGPESGMETSIISFTRSFKRRYFYLKQQADTTYVLEFHKDDRKLEAKGAIFLDSAKDIIRSSKRGKHAFEVQMQDKSFYVFAAESEGEMEGWVGTLKQVLSTPNSPLPGDRFSRESEPSPSKGESFRDSLEHSNNPELQKYARETDKVLAQQRKDGRQKLFGIYPDIQVGIQRSTASLEGEDEPEIEVYREQFGTRIIVRCEDLKMRLQANMAEDGHEENLSNPEPFFISLALFDAKEGKKISEDFHVDLNAANIRGMIPQELIHATDMLNSVDGTSSSQPELQGVDPRWIQYPRLAVFSVTKPGPDIYLVVRVEKVLQGSINQATEPYIRTPDIRVGTKIHKHMKTYCNRLGHYRMPFAWAARPVFKPYSMELDTYSDFVLYRQEGGKVSDDDLIKHLQDLKKPEKQGKWVTILGTLKINMYAFKSTLSNTLSSSLLPVKPFNDPPEQQVAKEVEEFVPEDGESSQPFVMYTNHLHVYPKYLKYDNQKSFAKSRNIACYAELRESDEDGTVPLKCIYGKPGSSIFTTTSTAAVLHHNTSPDFYEEIKMSLPAQLHDRHHLVFTFYHVSCELSKGSTSKASSKKAHNIESPIGYAWFPILVNGRVNVGEQNVRVSMGLPPGYLGHEQLGLGKGIVGPEIKWVDGGKQLFSFQLKLVSTTYTRDQHLHNFFAHCQKMDTGHTAALDYETSNRLKHVTPPGTPPGTPATSFDRELLKYVKSLHAVEKSTLINFLPTLFNQLFRLLTQTHSEDVAINAVRVLCHVVSEVHDVGKPEILHSYVKFVFVTEPVASLKQKSIHEELAMHLKKILQPTQADNLVIGKFMRHSWFFFEILIKSMAQHLLSTGRIKMARNERFPSSFQFHIQMLVQTLVQHIRQKHKEGTDGAVESRNSNISLAHFIKKCFTFMDRGFVFRLINHYIDNFLPSDTKVLYEYKFEFLRIVCNHEHYIQLNLPIMRKAIKNYKDLKHDYTLSDEFRRNHFLVGLLMHEVKMALSEVRDKRKQAIQTLRNLLAKHSFDERYASKAHQARIVTLYLPFLTVILENKGRLLGEDSLQSTPSLPNGDLPSQPDTPIKHAYPSTTSLSILENSLGSALTSPYATQRIHRDPTVFAMISGQAPAPSLQSLNPSTMDGKIHHGSNSSLASTTSSGQSQDKEKDSKDKDNKDRSVQSLPLAHHQRASSISGPPSGYMMRYEKLDQQEIKDLLICFLFIIKNLSEDVLLGWFNNSSDSDVIDFFTILEICMQNFKYLGRKRITSLCIISDTKRAHTLPNRITNPVKGYLRSSSAAYGDIPPDPGVHSMLSLTLTRHEEEENIRRRKHALPSPSEADAMFRTMLEANLSSEVAMIVLDIVSLYTNHFKEQLQFKDGENVVMHKVFDLYLHFLQTSQSEAVQKHAFAALRAFINKFPKVLFQGEANMCGKLCYEILRCCNSRLNTTRSEACALMYILMRSNFEFSYRKSFTRVHLQVIISVSQLISELSGLRTSRFTDSLSIINSFANNDKAMSNVNVRRIKRTVFPVEVKDLTKRIRTVLMATSQMREHENDPEMLVDLQYSLAKSYASTPELRRTWLESMARIHIKHESFSEAAHCYIHIAALVAEYLRRRGEFPQGCAAFKKISPNVDAEESGMRDDSGMQDVQYTEDHLVELLEECALYMEKAERYEILGEVYRLIIPIYEKRREFQRLASAYQVLYKAYTKVGEVQQSGRRLLGKYFRVAFFGQNFFEEEDGKEYIYKEPKITNLTEICDRLFKMYTEKFGNGTVKLIMDSSRVNQSDLDSKFAYVQVTYVTPHFEEKELEDRTTDFERNNNIRRFMYETPFTKNGKARGEIEDQYKKRNILTTSHSFPYVKKRIMVIYHKEMDLTPIEVAIDEMQKKVEELQEVISKDTPDLKKLQLRLAGSVSVQVNAGPLAYAEAFLEKDKVKKYKTEKVNLLKDTFREFVKVCDSGVNLNGRLVNMDQIEYQENLRQNLRDMVERLSEIFEEYLIDDDRRSTISGSQSHRGSLTVFNVISATGNTSNV